MTPHDAQGRCPDTPETCMDDLCRSSEVGLCGNWSSASLGDLDDELYMAEEEYRHGN